MSLTKYRYRIEQVGEGYCLDKVADKVNGVFYLCTEVDAVIADLEKRVVEYRRVVQEAEGLVKELKSHNKWLEVQHQNFINSMCKANTEIYEWKNKPLRTHFKSLISRLFTHQR